MCSLWSLLYYIGGTVLAIGVIIIAFNKWSAYKRAERRKKYPANTVILHQLPRGPYAPSLSPFPLKLETYLRMANIPHQNVFAREVSSKGKIPFITYNGQEMTDSQFIIDFLNKKLDKDMNNHLSKEQRAIARAFQKMMEENFYWVLAVFRWVHNTDDFDFMSTKSTYPRGNATLIKPLLKMFKFKFKAYTYGQGMGRHTLEEVCTIARGDLTALSDFIGTKPFLFGEQPCEQDCGIFGQLAQIKWQLPDTTVEKMLKEEFPNLSAYCDRMKDRFWPDWDECNTAGATRMATK